MAFRRTRKTPFRRRRSPMKTFAKKRRTWVTSFNQDLCNVINQDFNATEVCQDVGVKLILISSSTLHNVFSDRARVVRVLGDLWLWPTITPDGSSFDKLAIAAAGSQFQGFVGLRRHDTNPLEIANESLNYIPRPLQSDSSHDHAYDLSESQWKKTWQHTWFPSYRFGIQGFSAQFNLSFPVQCNDVHTTGVGDNDFVDGTGTINIETTCNTPDCVACPQDLGDVALVGQMPGLPGPWHVHVDYRKPISLREDQELEIDMQVVSAFGNAFQNVSVLALWGNVRSLLEY